MSREQVPDLPQPFGYKNAWYALCTSNTDRVIEELGLKDAQPANWATGIEAAYALGAYALTGSDVFVTPPLGQWTLVVGLALFPPDAAAATVKPLLERLSRVFTDAQFYATHRVVEGHLWARALNGCLIRAYFFVGDQCSTRWDEGPQSAEERALGFAFFDERLPEAERD